MVHAIEILEHQRRQGWARGSCGPLPFGPQTGRAIRCRLCAQMQIPAANRLYTSLGMAVVGHYHYRYLPDRERQP